jgi:predicted deacetylase
MHLINMKKRVKKRLLITILSLLFLLILFFVFFLIRLVSSTEIDDISPGINCPEIEIYNPDTLYVIPNYNNNPISDNKEWCDYILSLNKTLALHGITHSYREFLYSDVSQIKLTLGILEFERCFNQTPEGFKSPQMKINKKNKQLIKNNNLKLKTKFSQLTHKVYHCSDSGIISNKVMNIF